MDKGALFIPAPAPNHKFQYKKIPQSKQKNPPIKGLNKIFNKRRRKSPIKDGKKTSNQSPPYESPRMAYQSQS